MCIYAVYLFLCCVWAQGEDVANHPSIHPSIYSFIYSICCYWCDAGWNEMRCDEMRWVEIRWDEISKYQIYLYEHLTPPILYSYKLNWIIITITRNVISYNKANRKNLCTVRSVCYYGYSRYTGRTHNTQHIIYILAWIVCERTIPMPSYPEHIIDVSYSASIQMNYYFFIYHWLEMQRSWCYTYRNIHILCVGKTYCKECREGIRRRTYI